MFSLFLWSAVSYAPSVIRSSCFKVLFACCLASIPAVARAQTLGGVLVAFPTSGVFHSVFHFGTETLTLNGGVSSSSDVLASGTGAVLMATSGMTLGGATLSLGGFVGGNPPSVPSSVQTAAHFGPLTPGAGTLTVSGGLVSSNGLLFCGTASGLDGTRGITIGAGTLRISGSLQPVLSSP
ncbi:MAG: hypothetical protein EBS01_13635, partial [Verrucomicrobia bacterium]|nr:hypothetical protein [Verrucomicrobiota bacterium]